MSENIQTYVIRRTFLFPLGLLFLLTVALGVIGLLQGQPRGKLIILLIIVAPVAVLLLESLFRRVEIGATQVRVIKLLRRRALDFAALTAVETVQVRKRVFLTICADDEFIIISNAYGDFPQLLQALLARVPEHIVSEETRALAATVPMKSSDVVSCWLAVALLLVILWAQFGA
ncbi:MAG: hypothetical protein K0A93_00350 [Desulfuromonadaceae bacterium]|nr:hypothetical protein [Desulfuromonadaceae bacterium]